MASSGPADGRRDVARPPDGQAPELHLAVGSFYTGLPGDCRSEQLNQTAGGGAQMFDARPMIATQINANEAPSLHACFLSGQGLHSEGLRQTQRAAMDRC